LSWVTTSRGHVQKTNLWKAGRSLADRMRKIAAVPAEEVTYSSAGPGEKRAERKATKSATVTTLGGERVDVVVKNVSSTGARVEFLRISS
jgi:hypothetical protein